MKRVSASLPSNRDQVGVSSQENVSIRNRWGCQHPLQYIVFRYDLQLPAGLEYKRLAALFAEIDLARRGDRRRTEHTSEPMLPQRLARLRINGCSDPPLRRHVDDAPIDQQRRNIGSLCLPEIPSALKTLRLLRPS